MRIIAPGHERVAHFDHCGFAGFTPDPALKFGMRSASPPLNQPFCLYLAVWRMHIPPPYPILLLQERGFQIWPIPY